MEDYNRKLLTTVLLALIVLIGLIGSITFGVVGNAGATVFFLTIFGSSANALSDYYSRAWQNNP